MPLLLELEYKARQASATFKGISFDFRHRVGDGDARQPRATTEGFISDFRHRVGDGDARQARAA